MFDWVGSLRVVTGQPAESGRRLELRLTRATEIIGWLCALLGLGMAIRAVQISPWLAIMPLLLVVAGMLLASLRRRLVFDRDGGVLRIEQSVFGLVTRTVVPLFHLRAVVIAARPTSDLSLGSSSRYIAYLDRRVGEAIYLDEARRCASLMRLAEAIADVAELRLEYDAQGDEV